MELLYEPSSQKQAFIDACEWAEEIFLCLAWIEPGDTQGPAYSDLRPHEGKVRQAIVGLERFQSYPALLRRLHRLSVLRLVSTVDGSFTPNCYLFRRGSRVRTLIASAPFTSTRFSRPCESLVVFEGDRDEPFALRALQLLDQCRSFAHVPTSRELDAYEDAWAQVRSGGSEPEAIAGLALQPFDASALGTLILERDRTVIRDAMVAVRDAFSAAASIRVSALIRPDDSAAQADRLRTTVFWMPLGVWGAVTRSAVQYGLHFGFVAPWEVERPIASLSLTTELMPFSIAELSASGALRGMASARADDGRLFLVHIPMGTGEYGADAEVVDDSGSAKASVIGQIGAPDFVQTAAAFARRKSRSAVQISASGQE